MKRFDPALLLPPILITTLSLQILLFGDSSLFLRQLIFSCVGLFCVMALTFIHYLVWVRLSQILYLTGIFSLLTVLLVGREINGARSWFELGPINVQPAELFKIILCLSLAPLLKRTRPFRSWSTGLIILIPVILVVLQPDLGSAAALLVIAVTTFFTSPVSFRKLIYGGVGIICILIVSWFFILKPYQKQRLSTYFFPERAPTNYRYQLDQSLIAIGSGEITGKGIKESSQGHLRFLPAQYTDFIFAVMAEQRGYAGVLVVIFLYSIFFYRALSIVSQFSDEEGKYLGILLCSFLFFHVGYNIGMISAMVPVTGIPLPFMSYGGSFLVTCYIAIGLLNNLSMYRFGTP